MVSTRSSFALSIGFSTLVVLIAVLGFGSIRRADSIYRETERAQDAYLQREELRRAVATDMYQADILVRDYVLDPTTDNASHYSSQLSGTRATLQGHLDQLVGLMRDDNRSDMQRLQKEVDAYWTSLDTLFAADAGNHNPESWRALTRSVLSRRETLVTLAREVAGINNERLEKERLRIRTNQQVLHKFLIEITGIALLLGTVVAVLTYRRVAALERQDETQRLQIEETQDNLRLLSRRLVEAQEVERTALSRELHDEVGQTMTALGIELGNLDAIRTGDAETFRARLDDIRRLNADAMRAIRHLAMGLRPSMLDDLGLAAALEWQGREFSRHTGVRAIVNVDAGLDDLSDAQRTGIYRIVQEALTNCARHAQAENVEVSVRVQGANIAVAVEDDGVGFKVDSRARGGLGLLGIQERVQALDGHLRISSEPRHGTKILVEIPCGVMA